MCFITAFELHNPLIVVGSENSKITTVSEKI